MFLSHLIDRLALCSNQGSEKPSFLVARHRPHQGADEDKDIWSLVGPVKIGTDARNLLLKNGRLKEVKLFLEAFESKGHEVLDCQQDLFVVTHESDNADEDKDIWSVANPSADVPCTIMIRSPSIDGLKRHGQVPERGGQGPQSDVVVP